MNDSLIELPAKRFAGLAVRTSNAIEKLPGKNQIPNLWQRFFSENILAEIQQPIDSETVYGVYSDYAGDHQGDYQLLAGYEIVAGAVVSPSLTTVELPPATYLVFSGSGELPQAVFDCWQGIWKYFADNREYRRSFSGDFECYRGDHLAIYIAVSKRSV